MTLPRLDASRARGLVARFRDQPLLVVGDAMLDRFLIGEVTRISPEAPVPIVKFEAERVGLGGAANVAHNILALGGRPSLVGVVGADAAAECLVGLLKAAGVGVDGLVVDAARPTTEKVRIVTARNQQVARIDYEGDAKVSGTIEQAVLDHVRDLGRSVKALLASDYLKGAVTQPILSALVALKSSSSPPRPLIVDPKTPRLERYAGATLVTPNHHEAERATALPIRTDDEARAAARAFVTRAGCEGVLITRGEHGMWLSHPDAEGPVRAVAREVADVTGVGDTMVATLALALAAGATVAEAAALANHAAGIAVGKSGPAIVTPQELLEQLDGGR